jgi:hypothetical protein
MKCSLIGVTFLVIGLLVGWYSSQVCSYFTSNDNNILDIDLEEIFKFSEVEIRGDNYSCEGDKLRTVGAVLGSMFQSSMNMPSSRISMICHENKCGLIFNYCRPWQTQECGSKILRFDLSENKAIIPKSFTCIDAP